MPAGIPRPGQLYRLAWGLYLALAVAAVVWLGLAEGAIGLGLFVDPPAAGLDLALGLAAGGALVGVWQAATARVAAARALEGRLRSLLGPLAPAEVWGLALLSGFAEELFFRGAVQRSWGWPAATVLFALLHSGRGPAMRLWTLFALLAGALFAALVEWRGALLPAIVAHVAVNAVNLRRLRRPPAAEAG